MENKRRAPHHEPVTGTALRCALRRFARAAIASSHQNHRAPDRTAQFLRGLSGAFIDYT
ncbi:MAG TPA: hypothetical protein PLR69_09360 [Candidatus Limiplasma sp.]|nr:hypothetical protein [Candidatus Limiplasma sp.]